MKESDPERDERISMEVLVDCYDEGEEAMAWYYYLQDNISFPFIALCIEDKAISPLQIGEEVQVLEMAREKECERGEMFVFILHSKKKLAVPLVQLEPVEADDQTVEAVLDWHYWNSHG